MKKEEITKEVNGVKVDAKNIKIMLSEDLTMESEDLVIQDNGKVTFEVSRNITSQIGGDPSKIVATYKNELGVTSAVSEVVGMSSQDKDKVAIFSFDIHGWEDVGRFKEIQVTQDDILIKTFSGDGDHLVQLNKGSKATIKLVDKEDMDIYRARESKAIFEIRDVIADESIIDIDQLTVDVDLTVDSVKEDRHFRMYYFDLVTFWSEPAGIGSDHNRVFEYKEGTTKTKPRFYYVTYNRCQTDILNVGFYDASLYDGVTDGDEFNPGKYLEQFGRPADDEDWLLWTLNNMPQAKNIDVKLIQDRGTNIIWEVMPQFDTTSNKEQTRDLCFISSYGRIRYMRKFSIKYIPKVKSLFKR